MTTYTLEQLCNELRSKYGEDFTVKIREFGGGLGADYELWQDNVKKATWDGFLVKAPALGSNEPRGPKEYYNLKHL